MRTEALKEFVESSITPICCAYNIREKLQQSGFVELNEDDNWTRFKDGEEINSFFVIRGNSVIALKLPKKSGDDPAFKWVPSFKCVLTHLDSPCLKIKNSVIKGEGCSKFGIEKYGSPILYSWLDRPLGIAGTRCYYNEEGEIVKEGVDSGELRVIIPSQAIHINREVNNKNELKLAKDMMPIVSISEDLIKDTTFLYNVSIRPKIEDINLPSVNYDLQLYNAEPVKVYNLFGTLSKLITGPRLDNLVSVYSALDAFLYAEECDEEMETDSIKVFAAFDGEEVGSQVVGGADTNFLTSVLERVTLEMFCFSFERVCARSACISVDAAHAIHPNAPEKFDKDNCVKIGRGIAIKHNQNYAQDIMLETLIKSLCGKIGVKFQKYYHHPDMPCGSTLGKIAMTQHGIKTIDIGVPMHAMHSASETIAERDYLDLTKLLQKFYEI